MKGKKLFMALLTGTMAFSSLTGKAQSNIERMQTGDKSTSRIRPNLVYSLPFNSKGYTFIEFYDDGKSYYAKTGITKKIGEGLDGRVDVMNYSSAKDQVGLGVEYKLPLGEKSLAKVKAMPVYLGLDGKHIENKAVLGFYFNQRIYVPIMKDANVVAFGEINVAAKGGPSWGYGEIHVQKTLDDFILGIGADLRFDGDVVPNPNLSVKLAYVFGQK